MSSKNIPTSQQEHISTTASCVWCPHLKKTDLIEQVQRRATRLVPETKGLPYNSRLKELQLPILNYRRQRTDTIQTFKIIKRIDSVNQDCRCSQCPSKLMLKQPVGVFPNPESNWQQTPFLLDQSG